MYAPFFPSLFLFFAWARAVPLSLSLSAGSSRRYEGVLQLQRRECRYRIGSWYNQTPRFPHGERTPPPRTPLRFYRATSRGLLCS